MNFTLLIVAFILFPLCSMVYIYKFRGQARFSGVLEYLRKGWPVFAPLNVLLYLSSKKYVREAYIPVNKFNHLTLLEDHWQDIAEEAQLLVDSGYFDQTITKENSSYYDVGFRTFYKYGWSKFYCTWYGTTLNSALAHCPKTVALLKQIPSVNGAMFTLLAPHSKLTRHLDPMACSLRYHLGINTPNSQDCFINVDGEKQAWKNGEAFVFDETYLHYVENNTDKPRLILMCDINRPTHLLGSVVNWLYKKLVSQMLVPNLPGDQAGVVNRIFARVTPFLDQAKQIKQQSPKIYYPLKWCFNTSLLLLLITFLYAMLAIIIGLI